MRGTLLKYLYVFFYIFFMVSCGEEESSSQGSEEHAVVEAELDDISQESLIEYIEKQEYKNCTYQQSEVVDSIDAHGGKARTYFNDIAANALNTNETILPKNSIIIKELYESDEKTIFAYALMLKWTESAEADSWMFFEGFLPDYSKTFYGLGNGICAGCHSQGVDYVRSTP